MKKDYGATLSTYSKSESIKKVDKYALMGDKRASEITIEYKKPCCFYKGHITVEMKHNRIYVFNANDFIYAAAFWYANSYHSYSREELAAITKMTAEQLELVSSAEIRGESWDDDNSDGLYKINSESKTFGLNAPIRIMEFIHGNEAEFIGTSAENIYRILMIAVKDVGYMLAAKELEIRKESDSKDEAVKAAQRAVSKMNDKLLLMQKSKKQLEKELADHKEALAKVHELFSKE